MKITATQQRSAVLRLSLQELVVINNALNEVVNGRGVPDFQSRIGTSIEEVDCFWTGFATCSTTCVPCEGRLRSVARDGSRRGT